MEQVRANTSRFRLTMFGVLAIALFARLSTLGEQDYWLDELHSLLNSAAHRARFEAIPCGEVLPEVPRTTELSGDSSVVAVWRGMRDDSHPPLYFLLLYGWRRLFGDSEFAVRFPSALFSVLSIVPASLILREYGRPRAAIGAALLLAVGFGHIQMGQQARPYGLSLLLVALSYWLLVKIERGWGGFSTRRRVFWIGAYGLASGLAVLTHYFAGLALLGQVVYVLMRFRGKLAVSWLGAVGCVSILCAALWLPSFLAQRDFISTQHWVAEQGNDHVWRTLIRVADLPVRLLIRTPLHDWDGSRVWWQAAAGLLITVSSLVVARWTRCREALVFVVWMVVPVVVLTALDLLSDKQLLAHLRYASVIAPGLTGLLAVTAAQLRRPAPAVLLGITALLVAVTLRLPAKTNPDARVAARTVQEEIRPGDLLVFDAIGWIPYWARREFIVVAYYLPRGENPVLMLNQPPTPATSERIGTFERFLVVSPRIDAIPDHAPETHELAGRSSYIRDVGWVYLFVRQSGAAGGAN